MIGSTAPAALHLVFGPAEHGVTHHALTLAAAAGEPVCRVDTPSIPTLATVLDALAGSAVPPRLPLHLHVTDRLLGTSPAAAALLVEGIAAGYPLSVTLHDLPQPSDGPDRFPHRAAAYRRIAATAFGVQVSSRHEQTLLAAIDPEVSAVVVPLPVPLRGLAPPPTDRRPTTTTPTVGVLGYLYPGKGHAEVLDALARLGRAEVALVALGGPSDGHRWLVDDLRRQAGPRDLEITGYLDDAELDRRIHAVTVPVVAPSHVSASGSLHRWIGCGRRPVVVANPYAQEVAAALPGCLTPTDDLPSAIARALDDPAGTWQDASRRAETLSAVDVRAAAGAQSAAIRQAWGRR